MPFSSSGPRFSSDVIEKLIYIPGPPRQLPELCKLPSSVGPCRGRRRMYFYNLQTAQCEVFYWGGCQGNENRFASVEECQQTCQAPLSSECPDEECLREMKCRYGFVKDDQGCDTCDCQGRNASNAPVWFRRQKAIAILSADILCQCKAH